MSFQKAEAIIRNNIDAGCDIDEALEYVLLLEREKFLLLKKNGTVDLESLRYRLRTLESDVATLSKAQEDKNGHTHAQESSTHVANESMVLDIIPEAECESPTPIVRHSKHVKATPPTNKSTDSSSNKKDNSSDVEDIMESTRVLELDGEKDPGEDSNVRRSSVQSTGSAGGRPHSHSKAHRRHSIATQPLYTMPNAFQYGIKLRDTKMNGMSMYEDSARPSTDGEFPNSPASADKRVQGSREREYNIRNITDKFSDSANGERAALLELRRAMGSNASEQPMPRTSFSQAASTFTQPVSQSQNERKQRAVSSEASTSMGAAAANNSLAMMLLGKNNRGLTEEFDGDLTIDSIDAPKRHSLADLAEVIDQAEDGDLRNENYSDRNGSDSETSSNPEGAIEFCIVEADWAQLHLQSQTGHLLTPLLPPKRSWRYPPDLEDNSENNTKELQDQSFFFPSGVKVDLVWPSVAALRSRSSKHIRHIVPFTDAQGRPTYACVLTITQTYETSEIAQWGDLIVPNLVNINRQKQSATCIQKCFRQYVAYRKMVAWQLHRTAAQPATKSVTADSPATRISVFARTKTTIPGDHSAHSSTTGTGSADDKTVAGAPARRTWSSFFSSTRTHVAAVADSIDSSLHGKTAAPATAATAATDNGKRPSQLMRSSSVTGASISTSSTPTATATTGGWRRSRNTLDTPTTQTIKITAAELEQAEARRKLQQLESQAEYVRRRVVVAQKAYCIISTSREYTYIFKVLDAIASAEGFSDTSRQRLAPLPFSSTLSTDDEASDDGRDGRSSSCSVASELLATLNSTSPIASQAIAQPTPHATPQVMVPTDQHPLNQRDHSVGSSEDSNHNKRSLWTAASATSAVSVVSGSSAYHTLLSPNLTTPSKGSLSATMDAFYQEHRVKRDKLRFEFLQDAEAFLLEHLTLPAPTALQQITSEFAFSPAIATQSVLHNSTQNRAKKLSTTNSSFMNQANSPILQVTGKRISSVHNANNLHNTSQSSVGSRPSTLTPSPRPNPSTVNLGGPNVSLSKQALLNISQDDADAHEDDFDQNNRFAHYFYTGKLTVHHIKVPGYIDHFKVNLKSLLTTKEWTCSVLFTHLNSQIIFKIINLLLMEKSLIIHGKNAGIVTTITMAVINLISPFLWEGIFVPLVPDNARELFGAPVPLIVGTTSAPRVNDVSSDTAILFLNDDNVTATTTPSPLGQSGQSTTELKFVAWFVRLPEVSADLPLELEMCRRIDYTSTLLCDYIKDKIEMKKDDGAAPGKSTSSVPATPITAPIVAQPVVSINKITNTIDSLLMSDLPLHILHHVRVLIVAIKRFNYGFCGCVISDPGSWKRFLRHSNRTGEDEFYPEYFMEPLRNHLEFQDAIVHTQLFVSFMDKLRKEQHLLDTFRLFIAEWIYYRTHLRKKRKYANQLSREQQKAKNALYI